jgi:Ca2+-binding RTX toxin-like protein
MRGSPGRAFPLVTACAVAAGLLGGITSPERGSPTGPVSWAAPLAEDQRARVLEDYAQAPLSFEENRGQTDPRVRYLTRGEGYTLYLIEQEAVFALSGASSEPGTVGASPTPPGAALRMALVGADSAPGVAGQGPLPGVVSYLKGSDPMGWHTGIPTFARVRYRDVYPGTDLVFRGTRDALEYDFLLAPGADPGRIALRFQGAEDLLIDSDGDLVITTAVGKLVHRAPVVYQEAGGERREVTGAYRLHGDRVGFALGAYDRARPLVIDPVVLAYSTFLGGTDEEQGLGIAVDPYTRQAYVTGNTFDAATDFPTTSGAFDQTHNGDSDAFVTKVGSRGATLSYSTFLGGSGFDQGLGIAVDGAGAAYVTGNTVDDATDFPTTPGAFEQTHNGGFDAFVTKVGPTGADLSYSTFLGAFSTDRGFGIAVDGAGAAYVTGHTFATDFPTTPGAFDQTHNGDFDAFVTKLLPTGAALSYSTFLGGSSFDLGLGIAVDRARAAYVTGHTFDAATDFPTTPGAFDQTHNGDSDAFVTKLGPIGGALSYSTFLGGSSFDLGFGIAVDGDRLAYVTGFTQATDFPTTAGAFDQTHNGGSDAFVTKVGPTGAALGYSTFLGGSGEDQGFGIAVNGDGAAYVTGLTSSATDFPTSPGAFDQSHNGRVDAFVTKLVEPTPPGPPPQGPAPGSAPTCWGLIATLTGTDGNDTITGTPGRDVIVALAGNDVVKSLGGGDVVCAGRGNDVATGGGGKDTIQGEDGKDQLKGGSGTDTLNGGKGRDTCIGGSGRNLARNCEKEKSIP